MYEYVDPKVDAEYFENLGRVKELEREVYKWRRGYKVPPEERTMLDTIQVSCDCLIYALFYPSVFTRSAQAPPNHEPPAH